MNESEDRIDVTTGDEETFEYNMQPSELIKEILI